MSQRNPVFPMFNPFRGKNKIPDAKGNFASVAEISVVHARTDEKSEKRAQPEQKKIISLRLSKEELARLARDSAGLSRSAFNRGRLFGGGATKRRTRGKHPVKDFEALARVLILLGRTNLTHDLNELDWAVQTGVVNIDSATTLAIKQACVDVAAIRSELIVALGLKPAKAGL